MEIKVLEARPDRVRILIKGARLPLVNALRRACYTEVPVMAVEYVEFFENNTVLYDEIIAHRLALIPLRSVEALEKYKPPEACKDAKPGDPECYAVLTLDVETKPNEQRVVYSGDLVPLDPDVKPVYDNIPIVIMAPEQKLRLRAYARLGYGKEHAKWMPVTVAAHRYLPVIKFDLTKPGADKCVECISTAAPVVAEKMKSLGRGTIEILEDIVTSGIYWCVKHYCSGIATLEYRDDIFILTVESAGQLPPELILVKAAEAIERKAKELAGEVQRLKQKLKAAGGQ